MCSLPLQDFACAVPCVWNALPFPLCPGAPPLPLDVLHLGIILSLTSFWLTAEALGSAWHNERGQAIG